MSVKRRDLIQYLRENGFALVREGGKHSVFSNGTITLPVKRHRIIDRTTANAICRQAGLPSKF